MKPSYVICAGDLWALGVVAKIDRSDENWMVVMDGKSQSGNAREMIEKVKPRYAFFLSWHGIVPPEILALTECVNFHCTELPYGRGGSPIENLILRGHTDTVLTALRMTEEVDAGPIYLQSKRVSLSGSRAAIMNRFIEPCAVMIREIVEHQPAPCEQSGEVVLFQRLPDGERESFWRAR